MIIVGDRIVLGLTDATDGSEGRRVVPVVGASETSWSVDSVASDELLYTFAPHANTVLDAAISPDGSGLVTLGDHSTMRVWELETDDLIADHSTMMGGYCSLSVPADSFLSG